MPIYRVKAKDGIRMMATGAHFYYGQQVSERHFSPAQIRAMVKQGVLVEELPTEDAPKDDPLMVVPGVSDSFARGLHNIGIETVEALASAHPDVLQQVPGVGRATAGRLIDAAIAVIGPLEQIEAEDAGEEEEEDAG